VKEDFKIRKKYQYKKIKNNNMRPCFVCGWSRIQIPGRPNLTQRSKPFATASTSIQVAVLPWCYVAELDPANSLHASVWYSEYNDRFVWELFIRTIL